MQKRKNTRYGIRKKYTRYGNAFEGDESARYERKVLGHRKWKLVEYAVEARAARHMREGGRETERDGGGEGSR